MWKPSNPAILVRKPRLYLAYGSNLSRRDMATRCPGAEPAGKMLLDGGRLVFRGVADVSLEIGWQAPVGAWRITPENEAALDRYEGVGTGFYEKEELDLGDGDTALIYLMTATGIMRPSQFYVDVIRQGYRDFGLDQSYLDAAIWHSCHDKDPCPATIARRERQRRSTHQQRLVRIPDATAFRRHAAAARRRRRDEARVADRYDRFAKEARRLPSWDDTEPSR
jgi:hypothetical protein